LADSIITLIKGNPKITQGELAEATKVSIPSIKRTMKILSDNGRIIRKGGKRYGYWEIHE
jgi:ATP-dependent DNA helicase RecG